MGGLPLQSISHVGIVLSTHDPKEHSKELEGVNPLSQVISQLEPDTVLLHVAVLALTFSCEIKGRSFVHGFGSHVALPYHSPRTQLMVAFAAVYPSSHTMSQVD